MVLVEDFGAESCLRRRKRRSRKRRESERTLGKRSAGKEVVVGVERVVPWRGRTI